jgi:hypothetical protein
MDHQDYLSIVNRHPRDDFISFEEEDHVYTVSDWYCGLAGTEVTPSTGDHVSVTSWLKTYFPKFDADEIIARMREGARWHKSKYYGMTDCAIKKLWSDAGAEARGAGTQLHAVLENYYSLPVRPEKLPAHLTDLDVHDQLAAFTAKHAHLEPYRTEWVLFSDVSLRLCGSVDILFFDPTFKCSPDGVLHLTMMDWKRSKKIRDFAWEYGSGPARELKNTNYYHYSLQLNIYRYLIHTYYQDNVVFKGKPYPNGIKIDFLYLVVMHPLRKKYVKIMCPDLTSVVEEMHAERTQFLSQ